jgi:hypothetical protein
MRRNASQAPSHAAHLRVRLPIARPCGRVLEVYVVEDDASFRSEFGVTVGRDVDDADCARDGAWGGGSGEEGWEEERGEEEVEDVVDLLRG